MHSQILSETDISNLIVGEVPTTNLIALWTFDSVSNSLSCDAGNGFAPVMTLSSSWVGDSTVASSAPFSRASTTPLLSSFHIVLNNTQTLVNFLPSWGPSIDNITILWMSSGIQLYLVDEDSCSYSPLVPPCEVVNSAGFKHR